MSGTEEGPGRHQEGKRAERTAGDTVSVSQFRREVAVSPASSWRKSPGGAKCPVLWTLF